MNDSTAAGRLSPAFVDLLDLGQASKTLALFTQLSAVYVSILYGMVLLYAMEGDRRG